MTASDFCPGAPIIKVRNCFVKYTKTVPITLSWDVQPLSNIVVNKFKFKCEDLFTVSHRHPTNVPMVMNMLSSCWYCIFLCICKMGCSRWLPRLGEMGYDQCGGLPGFIERKALDFKRVSTAFAVRGKLYYSLMVRSRNEVLWISVLDLVGATLFLAPDEVFVLAGLWMSSRARLLKNL